MARRESEPGPESKDSLSSRNVPIKKAQPINTPDDEGSETPAEGTSGGGNFITNAKDLLGQVGNSAMGAIKSGVSAIGGSWFGIKPIANGISNGVGKVAGSLNISKGAAGTALAVILGLGGAGIGVSMSNYNFQQIMIRQDDYEDDCSDEYNSALTSGYVSTSVVDVSAQMEENAEKIWALMSTMGMTDAQCAGILGNIQAESGQMDPTAVEGVYNEPYQIGSTKQALIGDGDLPSSAMNSWVAGTLASSTSGGINLSAYLYDGSNYCCGLGLIQWTGPRGKGLVDYADALGRDWYELEVQLARLLTESSSGYEGFKSATANSSSVADCTAAWYGYVERGAGASCTDGNYTTRLEYANQWYARLSSKSASLKSEYSEFANDVITLAGTVVGAASGKHATALDEDCDSDGKDTSSYDNSSLAAAAVSYAWETKAMGNGNNGTQLYQAVHDAMFPGDAYYMSCDRGVACAVVWSGADDNFPAGDTSQQDVYLASSSLWEYVGLYDEVYNELQPGDICITTGARRSSSSSGHIIMYVGNDLIQEKYPGASGEFVSASYNQRSPGCGDTVSAYVGDGYYVYRYVGDYSGTRGSSYTGNASGTS